MAAEEEGRLQGTRCGRVWDRNRGVAEKEGRRGRRAEARQHFGMAVKEEEEVKGGVVELTSW